MKKEQLNLDMSNFSKYWVVFMMEHKFKFRYEKRRNKINWIVFLKKTLKEIVFKTKRRIRLLNSHFTVILAEREVFFKTWQKCFYLNVRDKEPFSLPKCWIKKVNENQQYQ